MQRLKKIIVSFAAFLLVGIPVLSSANDLALPSYSGDQSGTEQSPAAPSDEDPTYKPFWLQDADIWSRIRNGFGIPDLENNLVTTQTNWYSARPDYIQRATQRASRYLYHVVEELEKRRMPTELALLPFVESAFNPQAYSSAKAAGMWQFIPSTGLDYNLKQNVFKDDRRDILASTDAALTYLQKLYGMFGDWQLALAAYNWGEGSVQRAVNRARAAGLPTDFNSLSAHMPVETRNYVPKLQAVKNIIASPEKYGISLPEVDNQPYFVSIGKTRDIDIKLAAQFAELSLDDFKALNPQFNRPVITGSSNTQILLPQDNAEKFKQNLAKWGRALSSWTAHTITAAREKVETLAARFGTTPQLLREVNHIPPRAHLRAGSTILVPKTDTAPDKDKDIAPELAENAKMVLEPDGPTTRRISVKVGKRDTLASIAKRHRVTVAQIKSWNKLPHDKLAAGQQLKLEVPVRLASSGKNARHASRHTARHSRHGKTRVAAVRKEQPGKILIASNKPYKKRPG